MQFPHFGKRMTSRSHNGPPKLFGVLTDASAFDSLATVDDPLDQDEALPVGVPTPSLIQDTAVPKLFSSDANISDENHDVETPDTKILERSLRVARRQAGSHTPFKHASLTYDCILSAGLVCAFPSSPSLSQRKRR